jgi:hypothetical protein
LRTARIFIPMGRGGRPPTSFLCCIDNVRVSAAKDYEYKIVFFKFHRDPYTPIPFIQIWILFVIRIDLVVSHVAKVQHLSSHTVIKGETLTPIETLITLRIFIFLLNWFSMFHKQYEDTSKDDEYKISDKKIWCYNY